jgi:hypothetical protein
MLNSSRSADTTITAPSVSQGQVLNAEVSFNLRTGSPSSSTTSGSSHTDEIIARYDRLHNYDGETHRRTENAESRPQGHTTISSGQAIMSPSGIRIDRENTLHQDRTNNSILTEERSLNSTHNQSALTETSGISPDDPKAYAPSALSKLWPPKGHSDSSLSLNTDIANAVALSQNKRLAQMQGTSTTSNDHNRSSGYHGDHSGSTFMQEQLPKKLGNEKSITETVNIAPTPPPLPPPPQSREKNQVTLKLPNSATAGSRHKKSFVFTPHDYTQSKINREDTPYPAKMMQVIILSIRRLKPKELNNALVHRQRIKGLSNA